MNAEPLDANTEEEVTAPQLDADTTDTELDSSPAPEENQEEKNPQNAFQDRINKVTAQKYEQERRADGLEAEVAALKAEKPVVAATPVNAPSLPEDLYDHEAMTKYHTDMAAYTQETAQVAGRSAYEKQEQQATETRQRESQQAIVSTYAKNAVSDGVDMDRLRSAEQVLNTSGISSELGNYITQDRNGAKIAVYLHDNPAVLSEVLALDPVSAGIKIANEIKPRALSKTPQVSNAPDPLPEVRGSGALVKDDFERDFPGTTFD